MFAGPTFQELGEGIEQAEEPVLARGEVLVA